MPSFYGYDGFGTVRQLTNSAGTISDTYDYDAFGNKINSTGSTPNSYLYRGEQYDSDLGLYYLRARFYNPLTGRFINRDPESGDYSDPATLHKYLYAGGDPINKNDPTGQSFAPAPARPLGGGVTEYLAVAAFVTAAVVELHNHIHASGRQAKCYLIGQFADWELDRKFKLCFYMCEDDLPLITVGNQGQACDETEYRDWGVW